MDNLELKVIFTAVDKFIRPVNAITSSARAASKELKATKDALKSLAEQQKLIDSFRGTNKALGIDGAKLEEARNRVKGLAEAIAGTKTPTVAMQRAFAEARKEAAALSANVNRLMERKQRLRHELAAVGIDTKQLSQAQKDLVAKVDAASGAFKRQSDALAATNKRMQRLRAAQADLEKSRQLAGKLRGAGVATLGAGAATEIPVIASMKAYADFETAMLGVARQVNDARDANGQYTQTYYEMGTAIKAMSERLPMAANDIAAIVEAGARMGIQGKQNLLTFAEMTVVMSSAFDLPVDQVGEDIGKLSQLYKVPIKDIQALGDTINYLDDNALAKGGDIIEVMKRIAGTADMAKMSFKEAGALGSTFLSLGSTAEVAASASNAMIRELSIANMQSKRFMTGLDMLKMKAGDVQIGMNKDATGTILKVLDAIKALPQQQQLEAATRLFGKEFGDDAAKLASNLDEYRRQLKLVNEERAKGSMQREADTRNNAINSRMAMAKSALVNIGSDLGETLRPELVSLLETIVSVTGGFRDFVKEHPQLAAGIMRVVAGVGILLSLLGGLMLAAGAILGPMALFKFSLTALGEGGGALAVRIIGILNPITKVIAAFTAGYTAGLLINEGISALITKLTGYDASLGTWIYDVMEKIRNASWSDIGGWILQGVVKGLDLMTGGLFSKVASIADGIRDTFKTKLGIKSPSRVFAELGGFTMLGLQRGLVGEQDAPLQAMRNVVRTMAGIGAGVALTGPALAGGMLFDNRAPITYGGAQGGGAGGNSYTLVFQVPPGTDNQGIASLVAREIERIESRRSAQRRGTLRDAD